MFLVPHLNYMIYIVKILTGNCWDLPILRNIYAYLHLLTAGCGGSELKSQARKSTAIL